MSPNEAIVAELRTLTSASLLMSEWISPHISGPLILMGQTTVDKSSGTPGGRIA